MGLFNKKDIKNKTPSQLAAEAEYKFFDEYLRKELQEHARKHFESIIKDNGEAFKSSLDETVGHVNSELKVRAAEKLDNAISQVNLDIKQYATERLDEQFVEYGKSMKEAQDEAFKALNDSAKELKDEYQKLGKTLEKNVEAQEKAFNDALQENMSRIAAMRDAQDTALRALNDNASKLEEQYRNLSDTLDEYVAKQEDLLIEAFQENMSQVVEHYLLGALGDQYDIKSQIPSVISQLEQNKQSIVDDMKL